MNYADIWNLPVEDRLDAFVERYKDLDENTGNRSAAERQEMAEIADVIMPDLLRLYEADKAQRDKAEAERVARVQAPATDHLASEDWDKACCEDVDEEYGCTRREGHSGRCEYLGPHGFHYAR